MPRLILVRHGESVWNRDNRFTGWTDVDLSEDGIREAGLAARLLAKENIAIDLCFTSVLVRAVRTLWIVLDGLDRVWLPVERHWRLNERHYGALQGLDKKQTAERHGAEQVHAWRRGYTTPPPPVDLDDPEHPVNDPRYSHLPPDVLPASECLRDVVDRVLPYWYDRIAPQLMGGLNVLITAHGNSLRALLKHLEDVSDDEISEVNIPTGAPRQYTFDDMLRVTSAEYLGDTEAVAAAAAEVAAQAGTA